MSADFQFLDVIAAMEGFLERRRPPENIRSKVDLNYRIENLSVIIFEIRPVFTDPSRVVHPEVAKATFIKSGDYWKVFWRRANGRWHRYDPAPVVRTPQEFVRLVEEDKHMVFWG